MMRNVVYASERVDVVRCGDCRHRGSNAICVKLWVGTKDGFFCAFGERRDEDGEAGERLEGAASASA